MSSPGFSSYAAAAGLKAAALVRGNESTYPPRNESTRGPLIQTVGRGSFAKE
jgi:hypothetical protein